MTATEIDHQSVIVAPMISRTVTVLLGTNTIILVTNMSMHSTLGDIFSFINENYGHIGDK